MVSAPRAASGPRPGRVRGGVPGRNLARGLSAMLLYNVTLVIAVRADLRSLEALPSGLMRVIQCAQRRLGKAESE